MSIATKLLGWALLAAGLGLASLAWSPNVQAAHFSDDELTAAVCNDSDNFSHLDARQQALCAVSIPPGTNPGEAGTTIAELIQRVVSILAWVAGVAAVIVVVVQGLRMILAGGDSSTISSARNGIIYALAGLAVAVSAPHLVGYIVSIL